MRVFDEKSGPFSDKVNFVDDQNMLVGYDLSQDCCEHADWFIADAVCSETGSPPDDVAFLEPYRFDPVFLQEFDDEEQFDAGGCVVFRLVADGLPDKFLHLFNSHNGYYAHGFTVEVGGKIVINRVV